MTAIADWLVGRSLLPEACEPEERAGIIADHRQRGREMRAVAVEHLALEADAGRRDRWTLRLADYIRLGGGDPQRLAFWRRREAAALARLCAGRARPGRPGHTDVTIGAQTVSWCDRTAAWSIRAVAAHPVTIRGVGIVPLWMLARDLSGFSAEAELAEAIEP